MPFGKLFGRSESGRVLQAMQRQAQAIRLRSDEIMITGAPEGNSWRGVYNGAIAFFPDKVLTVPQKFSVPILHDHEIDVFCESLLNMGFLKIVFSGYTPKYKRFFTALAAAKKKTGTTAGVFLIHHSSLTTNREDPEMISTLKELVALNREGCIQRVGFIKKGMAEVMTTLTGLQASYLIPMTKLMPEQVLKNAAPMDGLHLGVFTHENYRKNIDNQVAAALLFPQATVHVHRNSSFDYLHNDNRIKEHPFLEQYDDFLSLTGSMHLNFYVTLSECFGLFITESLALGVPCLGALNSGLFDYDETLKKLLVVEEFDNAEAIFRQAQMVLERRDEISVRGIAYVDQLNEIAAEKLKHFLNS